MYNTKKYLLKIEKKNHKCESLGSETGANHQWSGVGEIGDIRHRRINRLKEFKFRHQDVTY